MKVSNRQLKLFRRIYRKYKMPLEFLIVNINKVTRLYMYATSLHIVIKTKFRLRKNRAFILYNRLRKNLFQTKRKHSAIKNLSWTKRCALNRKKIVEVENIIFEDEIVEDKIVEDKIVENENIETTNAKNSQIVILSNILVRKPDIVEDTSISNIIQGTTDKGHRIEVENISADGILTRKKSGIFLDSPPRSCSSSESDTPPCLRISLGRRVSLSPPLPPIQPSDEESNSNSSDFHGFTKNDIDYGPGMLANLSVNEILGGAPNSPFVSEDLENFVKESPLDNCTSVEIPELIEEGLVCDGAPIPKMYMPAISDEDIGPRNVKYWMLDDEHTIYRELQRRSKPFSKPNLAISKHVQSSPAPATRDCWKASAWLSTEKGRFFLQTANIDNIEYKIIGTRGNNYSKFLSKQNSMASLKKHQTINCPPSCHRLMENFKRLTIINPMKKEFHLKKKLLTTPDLKIEIDPRMIDFVPKPSPLSKKCMINQSNNLNLGPLEIYEMPKIELEVFPKVDKPLDDFVKPYLKMIMPSDNISREWAEFAVSTLITTNNSKKRSKSTRASSRESFKFEIQFINNEDRLLVRKIFKRQEQFEKYFNYDNLEFSKNIDKSNSTEVACADMITDMINSIALGLSENSIIRQDPDINYTDIVKTNEMTIEEDNETKHIKQAVTKKEKHGKQKLLSDLKRLNATVIDSTCFHKKRKKDIKKCKELHCRLGCICQSLMGRPIPKEHCRKLSCMFECGCKRNPLVEIENFNKFISNEDALLHKKDTEKVEKDFCSTIVLTDNRVFLRKRAKKDLKRFADYSVEEEDTNKTSDITYHHSHNDMLNKENSLKRKSLYIVSDKKTINKFKHCSVGLKRLKGFDTVQPWCMIHCLYKCFCENEDTSGIPFKIQKVGDIVGDTVIHSRKLAYSFAKTENDKSAPMKKVNANNKFNVTNNHQKKQDSKDIKPDRPISVTQKYFKSCLQYGSRTTIIPVGWYIQSNKEYYRKCLRKKVLRKYAKHQKVLKRKIRKSLIVREHDPRKSKNITDRTIAESNEISMRSIHNNIPNKINDTDSNISNKDILNIPIIASVCSLNNSPMVLAPTITPPIIREPIITKISVSTQTSIPSVIKEDHPFENNFKFGDFITDNNVVDEHPTNREFHNKSILKLNLAVTKTMNIIGSIQKNNTKHIPTPVPETLNSHQWQYFLQAYQEGLVFVWEIKLQTASIVAVTKTNIMPLVPNALSVINIKAIRTETLPLVAKMLNANIMNDKLKTLSILLTGHTGYWRVIGFINSTNNYLVNGCMARPTPETHPHLSEKVNQLYNMLLVEELKINSNIRNKNLLKSIETGIPKEQLPPSNIDIRKLPTNEIETIPTPIRSWNDQLVDIKLNPDYCDKNTNTGDNDCPIAGEEANTDVKELDITPALSLLDGLLTSSAQPEDPFKESVLVENQRNNIINPIGGNAGDDNTISSSPVAPILKRLIIETDPPKKPLLSRLKCCEMQCVTVTSSTVSSPSSISSSSGKNIFIPNTLSVESRETTSTPSFQLITVETASSTTENPKSPDKSDPEYGFLVSNVMALGKIPTKKSETGLLIKIPHYSRPIEVAGIDKANEMLQNYLRRHIKEFVPTDLYLSWRFINYADPIADHYKLHNVHILNSKMIIPSNTIFQRRVQPAAKSSSTSGISSNNAHSSLSQIETLKKAGTTVIVLNNTENNLKTNLSPKQIAQVVANKPNLNQLKETVPLAGDKKTKNLSNPSSKFIKSEIILIDDDDD